MPAPHRMVHDPRWTQPVPGESDLDVELAGVRGRIAVGIQDLGLPRPPAWEARGPGLLAAAAAAKDGREPRVFQPADPTRDRDDPPVTGVKTAFGARPVLGLEPQVAARAHHVLVAAVADAGEADRHLGPFMGPDRCDDFLDVRRRPAAALDAEEVQAWGISGVQGGSGARDLNVGSRS